MSERTIALLCMLAMFLSGIAMGMLIENHRINIMPTIIFLGQYKSELDELGHIAFDAGWICGHIGINQNECKAIADRHFKQQEDK